MKINMARTMNIASERPQNAFSGQRKFHKNIEIRKFLD